MTHRNYILSLEGKDLTQMYIKFRTIFKPNYINESLLEGYNDFESIYDIKNTAVILDETENEKRLEKNGNVMIIGLENLIDDVEKDILKNGFKLERKK